MSTEHPEKKVQVTFLQGVHIFSPEGFLDHTLSRLLFREAKPFVTKADHKILVDLDLVTMIGSMGFTVLMDLLETAIENGSRLEFCNLRDVARESMEIMGFEGVAVATKSRKDALERFGSAT